MHRLNELIKELENIQGQLEKEMTRLKGVLMSSPEGSLQVDYKNGPGREQYYVKIPGEKRRYLSRKRDLKMILQLGDKRYATRGMKILKQNIDAIGVFLTKASGSVGVYLADEFEEKGIPTSARTALPARKKKEVWMEQKRQEKAEDLVKNASYYERFKDSQNFETLGGDVVRSKGEGLIADIFFTNNIAYAYEVRLEHGYEHKYTDFVIYDPYSDREIYYEHFGMMDKDGYVLDAARKQLFYVRRGFKPGVDFIFTFETRAKPLTTKMVCETISEYIDNVELKVA